MNLLDIVRRKVLRLGVDGQESWGRIGPELYSLDLLSILFFIRVVAEYQSSLSDAEIAQDAEFVVSSAADTLTDWPTNFQSLLRNIGEKSGLAATHGSARRQFDRIYRNLFRKRQLNPSPPEFAKCAFIDFVMNQWGQGTVSPRLLPKSRDGLSKRFLTRKEAARHLGVTERRVITLVKQNKLPCRLIRTGNRQCYLFDRENLNVHTKHTGRVYSLREAARMLGLPVNVLRELKRAGVFVSTYLCPWEFQFHSSDLQAFKERILALTPNSEIVLTPVGGEPFITLSKIWRTHATLGGRAATVRAILDQRLPVIGNADGTVSGLMISVRKYKAFADDNHALVMGYMPDEAAKELHCDRDTIAGLVNQGLLEGQQTPRGLRVGGAALASFKQKYVSVSLFAKQNHSRSKAVLEYCRRNGIPIWHVQGNRRVRVQAFLRVEDTHRLRAFRARVSRRRDAAIAGLPDTVLRSLEQSGHFEVKHPRRNRFHHADIIAFTSKLFGLTRETSLVPCQDCITLENAMREPYGSIERKANLVRALLSTELPIVGNTNGTICGLLIPRAKFREFFRKQLESLVHRTGTFLFAARSIGCSRDVIPALVELRLLHGERVGRTLYISEDSIVAFRKAYVPIADVARPLETSAARLIRHCQENEIKMLVVPSKTRQGRTTSFMHVEDEQFVLSSFPKKSASIPGAALTADGRDGRSSEEVGGKHQ